MIKKTISKLVLAGLCFTAIAQPAQAPSEVPPKLEKLEEGSAPGITIRQREGERKMTEKREKGKVTEVKVHSGKSTYYVKPNDPAGSALPGDAQSSTNRGAQWQVKEFELGNQNQSVGAEAAKVPAPPPAIPEPAKK